MTREYEAEEVAPGITEVRMTRPRVNFLIDAPQVHIHYFNTDEEMLEQGFAVTELVCHGCSTATRITYAAMPPAAEIPADGLPELRAMRDAFQSEHQHHWMIGGEVLCQPLYAVTRTVDLRSEQR